MGHEDARIITTGIVLYKNAPWIGGSPDADGAIIFHCYRDSFASAAYETDDLLSFMSDELAQSHMGRACLASPETDGGSISQGQSSASSDTEEPLPNQTHPLPRSSSLPSYDSAMFYPSLVCPPSSDNTPEKTKKSSTKLSDCS